MPHGPVTRRFGTAATAPTQEVLVHRPEYREDTGRRHQHVNRKTHVPGRNTQSFDETDISRPEACLFRQLASGSIFQRLAGIRGTLGQRELEFMKTRCVLANQQQFIMFVSLQRQ